jgi:hypothetical protein
MESTVSLFVASSEEIVFAGLVAIATDAAIRIVGTARTAEAALAGIEATAPAVALIGCALRDGDGFALARRIASRATGVRVVLFSPAGDGTHLARARAARAFNCLDERCTAGALVAAIRQAAAGIAPAAQDPFAIIAAQLAATAPTSAELHLTVRERQVLRHLAYGLGNDEIAMSLGVGLETVKTHVHKLLAKIRMRDRTQAAVWAVKNGVV